MRKTIVSIGILLLSYSLSAQDSLTVSSDAEKSFQYRFRIKDIETQWASSSISNDLQDLFRAQVSFNETLKEFIFVSTEDKELLDILKRLSLDNYSVLNFRKTNLTETK